MRKTTFIISAICISILLFFACKKNKNPKVNDPCANIICQHGGTCYVGNGGYCECTDGYEGDRCESLIREKLIGSYYGTYEFDTTHLTITITADPSKETHVIVTGFLINPISCGVGKTTNFSYEDHSVVVNGYYNLDTKVIKMGWGNSFTTAKFEGKRQ